MRTWGLVPLFVATLLALAPPALATVTVDTREDLAPTGHDCTPAPSDCSVRQALAAASAHETVQIPAFRKTIVLASPLAVDKPLAIRGAGTRRTILGGSGNGRILRVDAAGAVTLARLQVRDGRAAVTGTRTGGAGILVRRGAVTLRHVLVTRNELTATGAGSGGHAVTQGGAGIYSAGPLTLDHSQVTFNVLHATDPSTSVKGGAGVLATGRLTIAQSDVSFNEGELAGDGFLGGFGVLHLGPEAAVLVDTDVEGNRGRIAAAEGGESGGAGVYDRRGGVELVRSGVVDNQLRAEGPRTLGGGGIFEGGAKLGLTNTTVASNSLDVTDMPTNGGSAIRQASAGPLALLNATVDDNFSYGGTSGALFNAGSTSPTLRNTVFEGNVGGNCTVGPGAAPFVSLGFNVEDRSDCGLGARGDRPSTSSFLLGTGRWGGPTTSAAPGATFSVAPINHGDPDHCPAQDQRGVTRPQGAGCDVGAVEILVSRVTPLAPRSVDAHAATVAAVVASDRAGGARVRVRFGPSRSYGSSVDLGTQTGTQTLEARLDGLEPGTTYHYRFVAENLAGVGRGPDRTFTTASVPASH